MSRPLRIEHSGALYHVTARGDRRDRIYRSDNDRLVWLSILGETCARFNFVIHAYCQMTNHYHLLVETVGGGLNRGMRYLNGNYSQYFNRTHSLVGHVYQGRYDAILCQRDNYLLELSRYIELNPVRARMRSLPEEWPWSSYRTKMGMQHSPVWLRPEAVLLHLASNQEEARQAYRQFVLAGIHGPNPLRAVKNQMFLGDEAFCQRAVDTDVPGDMFEIKRDQRKVLVAPLSEYFSQCRDPKEAMARAYLSLGYTMSEIALFARVSVRTVSRAVKSFVDQQRAP